MNLRRPILQLNASYEPLRIITARRAIELIVRGKAEGLRDVPMIRIARGLEVASVVKLKHYHHVPIKLPVVSKKNILVRDGYRCMYCGKKGTGASLELEHILPRSRGGRSSWDNLVASCRRCNQQKDDRTPEEAGMKLIRRPLPATIHTPRFVLKALGSEVDEWSRFLYGDSEGEKRLVFN